MKITKTIKLYAGGSFIRSESGDTFSDGAAADDRELAHRYCKASPKDLRNTVVSALSGQKRWASHSSYLRAQILYRMAEMTSARKPELVHVLGTMHPELAEKSGQLVEAMVYTMVFYAGFADKYQQVYSCLNPVSGPFSHGSEAAPVGVVALLDTDHPDPVMFCDAYCALLAGGNSVIGIPGNGNRWLTGPLAEIFATSDLPAGVANLLSTRSGDLDGVIARHYEIRAVCLAGHDQERLATLTSLGACNLKRVQQTVRKKVIENITTFNELKSVWQPEGF